MLVLAILVGVLMGALLIIGLAGALLALWPLVIIAAVLFLMDYLFIRMIIKKIKKKK